MEILVRDLDEATVAGLKERAVKNRRSLQAEVRLILEEAAKALVEAEERVLRLAEFRVWSADLRARNAHIPQTDSVELIREDRER